MGPFGERMIQIRVGTFDHAKPAGIRQINIRFSDFQRWMQAAQHTGMRIHQVTTLTPANVAQTTNLEASPKASRSKRTTPHKQPDIKSMREGNQTKTRQVVAPKSENDNQPNNVEAAQPQSAESNQNKRNNKRRPRRKAS